MIKGVFTIQKLTKLKITQLLNLGINTVFLGHQNLEKNLLKELHSNNLRVYTEISLFIGEDLWRKFPDSRPLSRKGIKIKPNHWYAGVCPNHPQVRNEKLKLIRTLIQKFKVDGIWLDFIRYPCHWEVPHPDRTEYCFCPVCLEKFKKEVDSKPEGERWIRWKCEQITGFVAEVHNLIKKNGKNIALGMFSVPWRESDFDGAIEKVIGQDFSGLAKYIDVFSPMVYHKMCQKPTDWISGVVRYMAETTGKMILPIIQTEDKPERIPIEEFRDEIKKSVKEPSAGVITFFLEDLLKTKEKTEAFKEL